jgi:DNA polymerase-3 subunit gamma/tau
MSRVIRFDLRPIPAAAIVGQMKKIAKSESLQATDEALFQIAREAQGGLRDALSLLDQIVSFSGREIAPAAVEEVVGVSTRRFVTGILGAVLKQDPSEALRASEAALAAGVEVKRLALDLLEYLRHLLVVQVSRDPSLFDLPPDAVEELTSLAKDRSGEDLDRLFRIAQRGVGDILRSPLPKILFDVLVLRLCHYESLKSLDEILKILTSSGPTLSTPSSPKAKSMDLFHPASPTQATKSWPDFLGFLRTKKPQLSSILDQGRFVQMDDREVVLNFPARSIHLNLLREPERQALFQELLTQFFGRPMTVRYEESESTAAEASPIVTEALSVFGPETARLVPEKRGS